MHAQECGSTRDIFVVMKIITLHIVMTAPAKMKFNNKHSADYFYGLTHKCCVHGSITSLSRDCNLGGSYI